jgi:hypothetical protein
MSKKQRYYVAYEVRMLGAIGVFYIIGDYFDADSIDDAQQQFMKKYTGQYELRFPAYCHTVNQ